MSLRLGDTAPDFVQESSEGTIRFHEWLGTGWGVLFSHPADFTPVCTTELGLTAKLKDEFAKRNVKVIALSVDPVESHKKWIDDINETQNTRVNFPIIADADRKVATLYDMIHPNANATLTVRSLFVIDPKKVVRLIITYPASTGRNFEEVLRVIDSLQLTEYHSVATPGNWKNGDDVVIVPSLQDPELIKQKFPKGYKALRPYLRMTPQPKSLSRRKPRLRRISGVSGLCPGAFSLGALAARGAADVGEHEIDLGCFEVDARDLDPDAIREPIGLAAALAVHRVVHGVEVEIVAAELGDVDQAVDVEPVQRHEQAEVRDAADGAVEGFADAVLHVVALEPVLDVARRVVGAPFGQRAVHAQFGPAGAARLIARARDARLDRAVHEQIRIAPDRRGEMRVGVVTEAEMPVVLGAVDRLLQRAQQHRLQQVEVGAPLDLRQQLRVVAGVGCCPPPSDSAERGEEFLERVQLLRRRAFVHAVQRRVFLLQQVFRRADIGGQHAFLDQLVRLVAHDRNDRSILPRASNFSSSSTVSKSIAPRARTRRGEHLVQRVERLAGAAATPCASASFAAVGCDSSSQTWCR